MRGFLRSNTFKVLLIAVAVIAAVMILTVSTGTSTVGSLLGLISTPMKETASEITAASESSDYAALESENQELRKQLVDYYELKKQNEQYEEALGISQQYDDIKLLPGSVISRDVTDPFYGFTVNLGSLDGVSQDDPVMSGKGLVGRVSKVYATSCTVTTILSEDLSIGATSEEFTESGVVSGNAELAAVGSVRMNYLTKETKITAGTIITTSGAGGMFPTDIIIGKVSYIGQSNEDVSLYAVVEPYEDIKTVSNVFVITDYPGKAEVSEAGADDAQGSGNEN